LDTDNVLGVADLAVMHLLKVLLELIKLSPESFPLITNRLQLSSSFPLWFKVIALQELFELLGFRDTSIRICFVEKIVQTLLFTTLFSITGLALISGTASSGYSFRFFWFSIYWSLAVCREPRHATVGWLHWAAAISTCSSCCLLALLLHNSLLKAFVIHIEVSHRLFLRSWWDAAKLAQKGIIVDFQLIFYSFLFIG